MVKVIRYRFRQDALALLLFFATFVVMSYPFIFQIADRLPMSNADTHTALWQNWWVLEAFGQGDNVNHTPLLFYPHGLDVTLQPRRWASLPIWIPLYFLFDDPLAFNLTAMFGILFKAYGMYLLGVYLFKRRIPAWVSGAFYAFAATSLQMALQQPNTGATEWIPWFMLAFVYGLSHIPTSKQPHHIVAVMALAGFLFAMNAYSNLKIALFAMLLGGGFVALYMLARSLWRIPLFWVAMMVFAVSAVGFSSPILVPTLQSSHLDSAIDDEVVLRGGIDLLSYLKPEHRRPINYMQSIASLRGEQLELQNIWGMSHVGVVSIVFALMGLQYALRVDRTVLIWLILAMIFWSLSLGLEVLYNRELVYLPTTPYRLLQDNIIFLILKYPWRMSLIFLFPYALLIGYGLNYRLRSLSLDRIQWGGLIVSVIMLLYGTSIFPIPSQAEPRPAYIHALAELPDGAVIDLPFGRQSSKYYMSVQRFHDRPIIEGMIARTPPTAYDYIDGNSVLVAIRGKTEKTLDDLTADDWTQAFNQLLADGFGYVILHKEVLHLAQPDKQLIDLLADYPAIYADDEVIIYTIDRLLAEIPSSLSD